MNQFQTDFLNQNFSDFIGFATTLLNATGYEKLVVDDKNTGGYCLKAKSKNDLSILNPFELIELEGKFGLPKTTILSHKKSTAFVTSFQTLASLISGNQTLSTISVDKSGTVEAFQGTKFVYGKTLDEFLSSAYLSYPGLKDAYAQILPVKNRVQIPETQQIHLFGVFVHRAAQRILVIDRLLRKIINDKSTEPDDSDETLDRIVQLLTLVVADISLDFYIYEYTDNETSNKYFDLLFVQLLTSLWKEEDRKEKPAQFLTSACAPTTRKIAFILAGSVEDMEKWVSFFSKEQIVFTLEDLKVNPSKPFETDFATQQIYGTEESRVKKQLISTVFAPEIIIDGLAVPFVQTLKIAEAITSFGYLVAKDITGEEESYHSILRQAIDLAPEIKSMVSKQITDIVQKELESI